MQNLSRIKLAIQKTCAIGLAVLAAAAGATDFDLLGPRGTSANFALKYANPGDNVVFTSPNGVKTVIRVDRVSRTANGAANLIGSTAQSLSNRKALLTVVRGSVVGSIAAKDGQFMVHGTANAVAVTTELATKGSGNDGIQVPTQAYAASEKVQQVQTLSKVASAANPVVIDLMILYSPSIATQFGDSIEALLENYVLVVNQAFVDSDVFVTIRLVHFGEVMDPETQNNQQALADLGSSEGGAGNATSATSAPFANVASLRNLYGADLVALVRSPNVADISSGLGYQGDGTADDARFGYSVISNIGGGVILAHELGHNIGLRHDRQSDATGVAVPVYGRGYIVNPGSSSGFADIMAYAVPDGTFLTYRFSNPNQTCFGGVPCGVADGQPNSADAAGAINANAAVVAAYKQTAVSVPPPTYPQSGYWFNPAEGGRGYFIDSTSSSLFMSFFMYAGNGSPVWYAAGPAKFDGVNFNASLDYYSGGSTLTGVFHPPTSVQSVGSVTVTFTDSTHAILTWPGGTTPIQRWEFVSGGLTYHAINNPSPTAYYWNPAQGGMGYTVEYQGQYNSATNTTVVTGEIAAYAYDASGNPVWYLMGGTTLPGSTNVLDGTFAQYGNGQTLTGSYVPSSVINSNVAKLQGFTPQYGPLPGQNVGFVLNTGQFVIGGGVRTIPINKFSF